MTGRKEWLYDERALSKLQIIMLLKEAGFKLAEINKTLQGSELDLTALYEEAIVRLEKKRDRLQGGINYFKFTIAGVKILEDIPGIEDFVIDESKLFVKINWKEALEESFNAFAAIGELDDEDKGLEYFGFFLLYLLGQLRNDGPEAESVQKTLRVIHGLVNKVEDRELPAEEYASVMVEPLEEMKNDSEAVEKNKEVFGEGFDVFLKQSLDYYVIRNGGELNA